MGEAGSGAASGNGGLGGAGEGSSGEGGGPGADPYQLCDQDLGRDNNPGCDAGTICRNGYCTTPCENNLIDNTFGTGEDCPPPATGDARTGCGLGYCWLRCFNGETCPDGLICSGVPQSEDCWNPDAVPP